MPRSCSLPTCRRIRSRRFAGTRRRAASCSSACLSKPSRSCATPRASTPSSAAPSARDPRLGSLVPARLAEDADAGPAALEAAEALDRLVPDDFLLDLAPRSVLRSLAPRPFDRLVAETADQSGVPRDLLYAIMRQESRFDREAASPAAARGLMQLTLPTAGEAARELNETPPAYAALYHPADRKS